MKREYKKLLTSWLLIPLVGLVAVTVGFSGAQALTAKSTARATDDCPGLCVSITPEGMVPNELAVKVGEYVQFNTADGKTHNLSLGDGLEDEDHKANSHDTLAHEHDAGFESGEFGPGEAYRTQFQKPGTYVMHDHNHPTNRILIVVYEPTGN